eukprot:7118539-Ditylum_brightwellii.AAC.1
MRKSVTITVPKLEGHMNWVKFKEISITKVNSEMGIRGILLSYLCHLENTPLPVPQGVKEGSCERSIYTVTFEGWNHIQKYEITQNGVEA